VAKGEAVRGRGFRRTGDDEADEEKEEACDLMDSEGIRGRELLGWPWSGDLLAG